MKMNVNYHIIKYFLNLIFIDMIFDHDPLICKYISPPKELQSLNCAVFYSGMIESVLLSNGFVKIICKLLFSIFRIRKSALILFLLLNIQIELYF
jgi:hypothetical protein